MFARSVIPQIVHGPMRTWSLLLSLISLLILVFYWYETTSSTSLKFSWSIQRYKILAFICIAALTTFELVSNILYYVRIENFAVWYVAYALPAIYIISGLALALFFIITTAKILLKLSKLDRMASGAASSGHRSGSLLFAQYVIKASALFHSSNC
jgi:hypothetical protein